MSTSNISNTHPDYNTTTFSIPKSAFSCDIPSRFIRTRFLLFALVSRIIRSYSHSFHALFIIRTRFTIIRTRFRKFAHRQTRAGICSGLGREWNINLNTAVLYRRNDCDATMPQTFLTRSVKYKSIRRGVVRDSVASPYLEKGTEFSHYHLIVAIKL